MSPIKEIPYGSFLAWSPSEHTKEILAIGRKSSNSSDSWLLEFVDLNILDASRRSYNVEAFVTLPYQLELTGLQWAELQSYERTGLISVGLNNGHVQIYSPNLGHNTQPELVTECISNEYAPITSIEFNSLLSPALLACGHKDGSLNVINLDRLDNTAICEVGPDPVLTHGNQPVTGIAWNQAVPHIVASTCSNGTTAIWNLKQRKASIRFRDPAERSHASSVAWVPSQATQVIVSYDDDANPSLQLWDLRNTAYPFKEFPGHTRGIVCIRVCTVDPSLLLTCGKDNRNVCWALGTSTDPSIYSEIITNEWQTSVRWAPHLPGVYASTSKTGGILVESVQEKRSKHAKHVPTWFKSPAGTSFGFGGKLAVFNGGLKSCVRVDVIATSDQDIIRKADEFETILINNDYIGYCTKRIQEAEDEYERLTWKVLQVLFYTPDCRAPALLDSLGFKPDDLEQSAEIFLKRKPGQLFNSTPEQYNTVSANASKSHELGTSGSVALGEGIGNFVNEGLTTTNAEQFFNDLAKSVGGDEDVTTTDTAGMITTTLTNLQHSKEEETLSAKDIYAFERNRDSQFGYTVDDDAVSKKPDGAKATDVPAIDLYCHDDAQLSNPTSSKKLSEKLIKTSLLVGQRVLATELCIESNRWADALLLAATSNDANLWEQTKLQYIQRQAHDKLLQIMACIVSEQWHQLIQIAELSKWEETLSILASHVPFEKFATYAQELGKRLETEMFDIRAAAICYLSSGSFKEVVQVWNSMGVSNSRGKSLQKGLQDLVEKVTILKMATHFEDSDPLFNQKVSQYAELLANSGRLVAGMKFLCLVSQDNGGQSATSNLKHRIYNSSSDAMIRSGIPAPTQLPFQVIQVPNKLKTTTQSMRETRLSEPAHHLSTHNEPGGYQQQPLQAYSSQMYPSQQQQQRPWGFGQKNAAFPAGHHRPEVSIKQQQLIHPPPQSMYQQTQPQARQAPPEHYQQHRLASANPPSSQAYPTSYIAALHEDFAATTSYNLPSSASHITGGMQPFNSLIPKPSISNSSMIPSSFGPASHKTSQIPPSLPPPSGATVPGGMPPSMAIPSPTTAAPPPPPMTSQQNSKQQLHSLAGTPPIPVPTHHSMGVPSIPSFSCNAPRLAPASIPPPPMGHSVGQHPPVGHSMASPPTMGQSMAPPFPTGQPMTHLPPMGHSVPPPPPMGGHSIAAPPPMGGHSIAAPPPMGHSVAHPPPMGHSMTPASPKPPSMPPATMASNMIGSHPKVAPVVGEPEGFGVDTEGLRAKQQVGESSHQSLTDFQKRQNPMMPAHIAQQRTGGSEHQTLARNTSFHATSTAPVAGASRIPPGMPVPWPIPTETQQVASNTQSTAPANQKLQATLDASSKTGGAPMNLSDFKYVQSILMSALEQAAQRDPLNTKKLEDLSQKLNELFTQLQAGAVNSQTQSSILQFCKLLEMGDINAATQVQVQLTKTSWTKESRNWLTALKRLLIK